MNSTDKRAGCALCIDAPPLDFEFSYAFQPIVDVHARRIFAHEGLVRGTAGEPAGSVLSRITPANRYAFDQACRDKVIQTASRQIGRAHV